jgi:hypothetical protein
MAAVYTNPIWSTDIPYIYAIRCCHLMAVFEQHSHQVLAWRVSRMLDGWFCLDFLKQANQVYGDTEIFVMSVPI